MIRATELAGRAVVDIDAAEKVGTIDKMILDPDARRVAGFVVTRPGSGFPGSKAQTVIPASAVHAIGPDAVTIRQSADPGGDISRLDGLPRGSDIIGRKVVSDSGRFLGKVGDILIDHENGRIVGYLLSEHTPGSKLQELIGSEKPRRDSAYLPAEANIRTGRDLIVTAEDAVKYDWSEEDQPKHEPGTPADKWGYSGPAAGGSSAAPNAWRAHAGEDVHPMARDIPPDVDGIDTDRETNPRVK